MKEIIHPEIIKISRALKSGFLKSKKIKTSYGISEPEIPSELLPFLKSLDIEKLVHAVRWNSWLYGHPIVRAQTLHLFRLGWEDRQWIKTGWKTQEKESRKVSFKTPEEAKEAQNFFNRLLESHLQSFFSEYQIREKPKKKKAGAKGGITNPYPELKEDKNLSPQIIHDSFDELAKHLRSTGIEFKSIRSKKKAVQICLAALDKAGPIWSSRKEILDTEKTPPTLLTNSGLPRTSKGKAFLGHYLRWDLDLSARIEEFTKPAKQNEKLKKDGYPAYLAYLILAALLETNPEKIRNAVENHKKSLKKQSS